MDRRKVAQLEDSRKAEQEALALLRRDVGENYEGGFGKILDDSPAAEIDQTLKTHRNTVGP